MKKTLIISFVLSLMAFKSNAQAPNVYAELGGAGLASLNFDTRFTKSEKGIGGRVGFGGFSVDGGSILVFPLGLNYLIGKDQKNYFELGAGATIVSASKSVTGDQPYTGSFGHLTLGYRLQPKDGGFTFRAAITPIFGQGTFWPYWGGVSFGYKF